MTANLQSSSNLLRNDDNDKNEKKVSRAKLKWFNAAKGFGFVVPEDNPVDAFLHVTQLQRMGVHGLGEGAEVLCVVDYSEKGAIVTELKEIVTVGKLPDGAARLDSPAEGVYKIKGIVKLYSEDRGFGFVTPDDGMKDIFVHKSCLDQCGITQLHPGQRVRILFKLANKGREALEIQIEGTP